MKTRVILTLDKELLQQLRILAAEKGVSVSALATELLQKMVKEKVDYRRARKRAIARLKNGLNLHWSPPASRDELHER
jgi:plasmid stability protein